MSLNHIIYLDAPLPENVDLPNNTDAVQVVEIAENITGDNGDHTQPIIISAGTRKIIYSKIVLSAAYSFWLTLFSFI
jgi:hypothetical protein